MQSLNIHTFPLHGQSLIEASAGTGKTYTIASLYSRLLLGHCTRRLACNQILVVTFTNAATEELRGRIRERIRQLTDDVLRLRAAMASGSDKAERNALSTASALESINPDLARWLRELDIADDADALKELTDWLNTNLSQMDNASIFTIHGFCQRMLKQFAFDSGVMFSAELLLDTQSYLRQACEDVWRNGNYRLEAEQVGYLLQLYPTPDALQQQVRQWLSHPGLSFLPRLPDRSAPGIRPGTAFETVAVSVTESGDHPQAQLNFGQDWSELEQQFEQLARQWQALGDEAIAELIQSSGVDRRSFSKKNLPRWLATTGQWFQSGFSLPMPSGVENFGQRNLNAKTRAGKTAPEHSVFRQIDAFIDEERRLAVGLPQVWFERVKQRYFELLTRAGALAPDDLLRLLDEALSGPQGDSLAKQIQALYPVGLIDEFQDTDPLQYRIFSRIYSDHPPEDDVSDADSEAESDRSEQQWGLAAIGDPKQAIYAFRGADIFTYISARRALIANSGEAPIFTLDTNWRSHSQLVDGVNALFDAHTSPFVFDDDIPFHPVKAAGKHDHKALTINGQVIQPLQLWLDEEPRSLPAARLLAASQCAERIRDALNGAATLDSEPARAADIAVLVRSHQQAAAMRGALAEQGIGSVFLSRDSVLASREARDLLVWLTAVAEPSDERAVRRAMATETQGFDAPQLDTLLNNEEEWENRLERMASYLQIWHQKGIMAALMRWLEDDNRAVVLRQHADGERRLTNILHLGEMLQQASRKLRGHLSLLRWFTEQVLDDSIAGEEAQLRLETDANLVSIVTIHKSKGLEYPLVFLPFLWSDDFSPQSSREARYFDDELGVVVNLEPDDAARQAQHRDNQAEAMRLLYVALTRPVQGCFVWLMNAGKDSRAGWKARIQSSALGRLLQLDTLMNALDGPPASNSWSEQLKQHWQSHQQSLGHVALASMPDWSPLHRATSAAGSGLAESQSEAATALQPNHFHRRLTRHWRVSSFTQLSSHHETRHRVGDSGQAALMDSGVSNPALDLVDDLLRADDDSAGAMLSDDEVAPTFRTPIEQTALAFPRGATAGTCLHAMMEHWDFADMEALAQQIVPDEMLRYGLDAPQHSDPLDLDPASQAPTFEHVAGWLKQVVNTQLQDAQGNTFCLSELDRKQRLDEMEFCLPIGRSTATGEGVLRDGALNRLLADQASPGDGIQRKALSFEPLNGYLKGFIDLIFCHNGRYYVVDYKSNWLGESVDEYQSEALHHAMVDHHYDLQAWIYTVALDQLLSNRLSDYHPEQHLGGAFYLFMRGMTGTDPTTAERGEQTDLFAETDAGQRPGVHYQPVEAECLRRWKQALLGDSNTGDQTDQSHQEWMQ